MSGLVQAASQPLTVGMFIVGCIIFALYIVGYMYMINTAHKQQRRELENDPEMRGYYSRHNIPPKPDVVDYDGMGNQGRFPQVPKKKTTKRKAKSKSKMYI
jgi:hypothetical protein